MTDAPERIWAVQHETHGSIRIGEWGDSVRHIGGVEYVRADLVQAELDRMGITQAQDFSAGWDAARKVKPLVWDDGFEVSTSTAGRAEYLVERSHNGKWYYEHADQPFDTLESAKAAAQADYESYIMSALE